MSKKLALCCKFFVLPLSPRRLKEEYDYWRNGKYTKKRRTIEDIWLMYPMVISLKKRKYSKKFKKWFYHYKCKHLINNKCTIQGIKPHMCSIFDINACKHPNNKYQGCKSNCFGGKK